MPNSLGSQRPRFLRALIGCLAILAIASSSNAGPPVKLSAPLESIQTALQTDTKSKLPDGSATPIALIVDGAPIDLAATQAILHAMDDCRRDGRKVVAICTRTARPNSNGATLVALACNTVVLLDGSELEGVADGWCKSASARDDLLARFTQLSALDPQLAARLMSTQGALSWSSKSGFKPDLSGAVKVAEAGKPIVLDATLLKQLGVVHAEAASIEEAQSTIDSGQLESRSSTAAPPGSTAPAPGANPPRRKGATAGESKGVGHSTAPASSSPSAETTAKLQPKIKDYNATLAALLVVLSEFEPYFNGSQGHWGRGPVGLRQIWERRAVNDADGETKVRVERLIRDIGTKVSALAALANSIEKIAKDHENADARRVKDQSDLLHQLDAAIERRHGAEFESKLKLVKAFR